MVVYDIDKLSRSIDTQNRALQRRPMGKHVTKRYLRYRAAIFVDILVFVVEIATALPSGAGTEFGENRAEEVDPHLEKSIELMRLVFICRY